MADLSADVLIVGGGIAGPALAAALHDSGLKIVLLERSALPLDTARGDHLQPRSIEILDSWGALPDFLSRGAERRSGTSWYSRSGTKLLDASVSDLDIAHPYFLFLNHEKIGEALFAAAARSNDFELLRPIRDWQIVSRSENFSSIEVTQDDRPPVQIDARIVVGADGRNSRVRRLAEIDATSERYERPVNVFFGHYTTPPTGNNLSAWIGEKGILALIPRTGSGCKIGVASSARDVAKWRSTNGEELANMLQPLAANLPVRDVVYGGVYPPIRISASRWVSGDTVLIGDACHAMHPAQSQGMNVSIRCVDRLAHELTESVDAPRKVLENYERAIRPLTESVLEENHRAGMLFDSTDSEQLLQFADKLRHIGDDAEATRQYSLRTAGYPA
ncbi:MAG: FAD-dependent oxidoreductase [Woeseiaceae bacterium]